MYKVSTYVFGIDNNMRRFILVTYCLFVSILHTLGQIYEVPRGALNHLLMNIYYGCHYEMESDGLYYFKSNPQKISYSKYKSISKGNERFFCYVKEEEMYFFYTDNIIGAFTTHDKSIAKELKKSLKENNVKTIKADELQGMINKVVELLNPIYTRKNDSIAEVRRKQKEILVLDSIAKEKQKEIDRDEYRKTHDWHKLNLSDSYGLYCRVCDGTHYLKNITIQSLSSDTIYYFLNTPDYTMLGIDKNSLHYSKMTNKLKNDKNFAEYIKIWHDSIANNNKQSNKMADEYNLIQEKKFLSKVNAAAPDGFILRWGCDFNSADGIEPYFSYFNSSKKSIKYVDLYFSVYNDVGDRCYLKYDRSYVGKIRGVGPVDSFTSGSWKWDKATHYTSGDATNMKIVKLVITYMDGTIKSLTQQSIKYD
jgi:hypothetical protein